VLRRGIGGTPLKKLRAWEFDRFYSQLLVGGGRNGTPLSPATVRKVHTVLRLALEQAVRWQWLAENPALHASSAQDVGDRGGVGAQGENHVSNGGAADKNPALVHRRVQA